MQPDNDKILADIRTIQHFIEQITGLSSRWNGSVSFTDEVDVDDRPIFAARKEWSCGITLHYFGLQDERIVATLLHELLHSVSVGLTPTSFQRFRGYEEGVVEWLTRRLGSEIMAAMKISASFPARIAFDSYLKSLEKFCVMAAKEEWEFYLQLLQTPLENREATVVQWVQSQHPMETTVRVAARIAFDLRNLRG